MTILIFAIFAIFVYLSNAYSADWKPLVTAGAYYDKDSISCVYKMNSNKDPLNGQVDTKLIIGSSTHYITYYFQCNSVRFHIIKGVTARDRHYEARDLPPDQRIGFINKGSDLEILYRMLCPIRLPKLKIKLNLKK